MLDISIRFIPVEYCTYQNRVLCARTKPALCLRGESKAYGIYNDELTIALTELPVEEVDLSDPVLYQGEEYPIPRYLQHLADTHKPHAEKVDWLLSLLDSQPADFPELQTVPPKSKSSEPTPTSVKKTSIIAALSEEYQLSASKVRKFLRGKGFSKPYSDENAIHQAMKELV